MIMFTSLCLFRFSVTRRQLPIRSLPFVIYILAISSSHSNSSDDGGEHLHNWTPALDLSMFLSFFFLTHSKTKHGLYCFDHHRHLLYAFWWSFCLHLVVHHSFSTFLFLSICQCQSNVCRLIILSARFSSVICVILFVNCLLWYGCNSCCIMTISATPTPAQSSAS